MDTKGLPKVTFVTVNSNKYREFKQMTAGKLEVCQLDIDLPELQGDPIEVSIQKVKTAFKKSQIPTVIEDTSLCMEAYGGLPGPYIKWFLNNLKPKGLHKMLDGFEDKSAYAMTVYAYMENEDSEVKTFVGKTYGKVIQPRGIPKFGWDANFLEGTSGKTYAEMTPEEKNGVSQRGKAIKVLLDYFK